MLGPGSSCICHGPTGLDVDFVKAAKAGHIRRLTTLDPVEYIGDHSCDIGRNSRECDSCAERKHALARNRKADAISPRPVRHITRRGAAEDTLRSRY